jgi:hypothetical protein
VNKKSLFYVAVISLLLVYTVQKITSSHKNNPNNPVSEKTAISSEENNKNRVDKILPSESSNNNVSLENKPEKPPSLVKTHLLKKKGSSKNQKPGKSKRSIFNFTEKVNNKPKLPMPEENTEEKKEIAQEQTEILPVNFKLLGIIIMRETRLSHRQNMNYAVLSGEEEIFIVKKGDVLIGRYRILDISSETVEIKDILLEKTEIINLERE